MKYGYTILYVTDVGKTIEFYEKAFGFKRKMITPDNGYGELQTGGTCIGFVSMEMGKSNFTKGLQKADQSRLPFGIELAFTTKTIEKDFQRALDAGAIQWEPLREKPWGQTVGYLLDNNGFLIEICTPMDD